MELSEVNKALNIIDNMSKEEFRDLLIKSGIPESEIVEKNTQEGSVTQKK